MAQRNARSRSELKPKTRNLTSSFGEPVSTKRTPKQFTVNGTERPRTNPHANKSTMQQTHNALQILRSDFFNRIQASFFQLFLHYAVSSRLAISHGRQNKPKFRRNPVTALEQTCHPQCVPILLLYRPGGVRACD